LALGSDSTLRILMSIESRRMAEDATWEKINNRVAWKLAEALETQETVPPVQNFVIPIYSWLLLSPQLRNSAAAVIVDARLLGGIGIIFGVWCGLVITWIFVQLALLVRTRMPWARDAFRGMQNGVLV
jgi:cellobiose-specific phosphotransferase system component IIC